MRKTTKLAGCGLLAMLVAMFAILPAAGASASSSVLQLSSGGTPVATGSASDIGLNIEGCFVAYEGKVVANNAKKDILSGTSTAPGAECLEGEGESISGLVEELNVSSKGKTKMKANVVVAVSPTCGYTFTKLSATTLTFPGFLLIEGTGRGKLTAANKKACEAEGHEKTIEAPFLVDASNVAFGESFETALIA